MRCHSDAIAHRTHCAGADAVKGWAITVIQAGLAMRYVRASLILAVFDVLANVNT